MFHTSSRFLVTQQVTQIHFKLAAKNNLKRCNELYFNLLNRFVLPKVKTKNR
jgi:hypothetical protein